MTNLNHDGENAKYGTNLDDTNYSVYVLLNFALTFEKASYTYIQHNKGLKGLSHEIDFKNFDKNLQNLV